MVPAGPPELQRDRRNTSGFHDPDPVPPPIIHPEPLFSAAPRGTTRRTPKKVISATIMGGKTVPKNLFQKILDLIDDLRRRPVPA
jgi:hypothetical protein